MNIPNLLNSPEGKTLEFKRDLSSLKPILKTFVAFANTAGGTLIVGREDDGALCGVADALREQERLANAIADGIRPAMMPEIDTYSHEGKTLLLVQVPHWRGPFYVRAEGAEKGVYVRLGSTNRQAGPEMLAEMQRYLSGLSFDQLPCPDTALQDLDMKRVRHHLGGVGRKVGERQLETLGVLVPYAGKLVVSYGGLILFGKDAVREHHFPDARVSCARFTGTNKAEFLDRLDIEGSVLDAVDEVPRFIRRNTRMAAKIQTMRRQDIPEYPDIALREVLVNAIVHADYSLTGMRLLVAIYSDRMEVQNPGMLPFGMTLDDLKSGVSRIRNRVIARVFREMGLIEQWGSGYTRIAEACREGGYPTPEWQEFGPALRVTFGPHPEVVNQLGPNVPIDETANETANETVNDTANETANEPVNDTVNDRQTWFIEQVRAGRATTAVDIVAHWNVSIITARRDIALLKTQGLIEFVGAAKKGYYRLKEPDAGR
ncbi:MAG: putative DNA binding domain-containing protein [Armatimonadetes bacterium]|nr:putative DNA binding domain-containing protein [Armatimonadota bacterium]